MPIQLSPETEKRIALLFPPGEQELVRGVLLDFTAKLSYYGLKEREVERVSFAVLKLSEGKLGGLNSAIALGDYRDMLVNAGFGEPGVHMNWLPEKAW